MMTLTNSDLAQFIGSETFYRHTVVPWMTYTEGAKFVAERGGAYWLLDEIAISQLLKEIQNEEFQHWKLTVKDSVGNLTCDDGNDNVVFSKKIDFTDFPLDEIRFYVVGRVIMLPSEY
jgi:hypothetical protein